MTGAEGINFQTLRINDKTCIRCYKCIEACTTGALSLDKGHFTHDAYSCILEELCMDMCETGSIEIREM